MKKVTSFKSQVSSIGFAARKGKLCGGAAGLRPRRKTAGRARERCGANRVDKMDMVDMVDKRAIHAMTRDHRICGSEVSCRGFGSRAVPRIPSIPSIPHSSRSRPRRGRELPRTDTEKTEGTENTENAEDMARRGRELPVIRNQKSAAAEPSPARRELPVIRNQ